MPTVCQKSTLYTNVILTLFLKHLWRDPKFANNNDIVIIAQNDVTFNTILNYTQHYYYYEL